MANNVSNEQQELIKLREIIASIISSMETWETLNNVCQTLGLSLEENPDRLGKDKYLHKVTSKTSDPAIISAAEQMLNCYPGTRGELSGPNFQRIQDILWRIKDKGLQRITKVTRFRIAEGLNGVNFSGRLSLRDFLHRFSLSPLRE
jgi:hypothetical protein